MREQISSHGRQGAWGWPQLRHCSAHALSWRQGLASLGGVPGARRWQWAASRLGAGLAHPIQPNCSPEMTQCLETTRAGPGPGPLA